MKNIISILLVLSSVLSFSPVAFAYSSIFENNEDISEVAIAFQNDERIISNFSIDDEFSDDTIIVVLKKAHSKNDQEYTSNYFNAFGCDTVEDLTSYASGLFQEQIDIIQRDSATGMNQMNYTLETKQRLADIDQKLKLVNIDEFRRILKITLKNPGKQNVLDAIKALENYPEIQYAEPDFFIEKTAVVPNDTNYDEQWAIDAIKLPEAWEITTGYNQVAIGVLDSGVDWSHPDLLSITSIQHDLVNEGPGDKNGHGTHVSGIIGAKSNNNKGMVGVNWNVDLKMIKVFGESGSGVTSNITRAINYLTENGIKLANYSGGSYKARNHEDIVHEQIAINNYTGLFICTAGNGKDLDNDNSTPKVPVNTDLPEYEHFPSCFTNSNIISVGAHDRYNNWYYNYGQNSVDLAAPGVGIYSTIPDNGYASWSGTSMAAPHVTGVAALIMSLPNTNFTPAQVKSFILNGTDPVSGFENKCVTGGKLNAYRALRNALEMVDGSTVAGDFDGDGVDELAAFYGRDKFMSLIYWENNGGAFNMQGGSVVCTSDDYRVANIAGQVAAGDFDGDGIDEIGALYDYGDYLGFWVFKRQSNGRFSASKPGNTGSFTTSIQNRVTSGDFDGDGREELFALYNYSGSMGWWIFKQKVDGGLTHYCVGQTGVLNVDSIDNRIAGGDFDGDGRDEVGILYDNTANYTEMMILDYSTSNTFSYYTVGQTGYFAYGNMKGLISAGDYDGDGVDEMMGLYGHDQNTSAPYFRIWLFERTASGSFYHTNSELYGTFRTSRIANTMVTGKFSSSSARDVMAGIYRYDDTTARVFAFGRPSDSSWAYEELE